MADFLTLCGEISRIKLIARQQPAALLADLRAAHPDAPGADGGKHRGNGFHRKVLPEGLVEIELQIDRVHRDLVVDDHWPPDRVRGLLLDARNECGFGQVVPEVHAHRSFELRLDPAFALDESVFDRWRMFPAPKRGEIVREIGNELRVHKADLGTLVSLEMGKILQEGLGEVQEMIDIADFAVGLSRQLHGLTMHSERPRHRMYEQWHPLGVIGLITAFNFPVAVWSWNALIAAVCGDCVVWKPSRDTPLTAIAVQNIVHRVLNRHGWGESSRS